MAIVKLKVEKKTDNNFFVNGISYSDTSSLAAVVIQSVPDAETNSELYNLLIEGGSNYAEAVTSPPDVFYLGTAEVNVARMNTAIRRATRRFRPVIWNFTIQDNPPVDKESLQSELFASAFIERLSVLQTANKIDSGLDEIYNVIEPLLIKKEFNKVDRIFDHEDVNKLDRNFKLGMLVVSYPWKDQLNFRQDFYDLTKTELIAKYGEFEALKIIGRLR